ncbi:solute carrier family 2, facilitated glucose transporter member 10 [Megalops cyprinoides]|uniref:solute carrier family 2, facilitated glucose transporter member 10 n=1 Tax=Megalops cyprinoides TaxID=118141 RepID=UPI001865237E|nr:solute carrier family 2, facilitated glucose transporter member 10 [Megalops cyprinoides]XP_036386233.1 solute carrier family 2, facilitated glucose transporter member 10 [Megalops cyprinoides]
MGFSMLVLSSVVSTFGGLVFGYELAIISGALLQLQTEFQLSCFQQEAVVSALLIGALLASVIGGVLIDRHGRRNSILLSNALILGGSLLLLINGSVFALVAGRITVGFAMSISSMSCCIFVSEMVSPKRRGLLVTLYEVGITIGILVAYAMNYFLSEVKEGWKYMFGLAVAPTLVQLVSVWFLPARPVTSAKETPEVQSQAGLIQMTSVTEMEDDAVSVRRDDQQYSVLHLFQSKDNMRTRTLIGLGLVLFQQFTGQPNVLFYASTIFHSVGFESDASAVLASVGLGVVKVVATLVSMVCADKVGRRALLTVGCLVMTASLFVIGLLSEHALLNTRRPCGADDPLTNSTALSQKPAEQKILTVNISVNQSHEHFDRLKFTTRADSAVWTPEISHTHPLYPTPEPHGFLNPGPPVPSRAASHGIVNWIILISMMAFVSAYSIGFGPMTWLVLSEIFPAGVRGRAFAFTNCFNWVANLLVTFTFLNVIDALGLSWTFLLYGITGVAAVLFVYLMLPETKGKSLEEIDKELSTKRIHNRDSCCNILGSRRMFSTGYQRVHISSSAVQ